VTSAQRVLKVAGGDGLAALHVYPAAGIGIHHLWLAVRTFSGVQHGLPGCVRRAHVSRYFVTTEDHAGPLIETGPAIKLAGLPGG